MTRPEASIGGHFRQHSALGAGGRKGEQRAELRRICGGEGDSGRLLPAVAQQRKPGGQREELLEDQPPAGGLQSVKVRRVMDMGQGGLNRHQLMGAAQLLGQGLRYLGQGMLQGKAHPIGELSVVQPSGQGIDGDDAAGIDRPLCRLHRGIGHLAGGAEVLHLAIKKYNVRRAAGNLCGRTG